MASRGEQAGNSALRKLDYGIKLVYEGIRLLFLTFRERRETKASLVECGSRLRTSQINYLIALKPNCEVNKVRLRSRNAK